MPSVEIKVMSVGRNPLVGALEGSLDYREVAISRTEFAIKSLMPIEIIIGASSAYVLTKFVLDPLIGDFADRWRKAIRDLIRPIEPFHLEVELSDAGITLDVPPDASEQVSAEIWSVIRKVLDVLEAEDRLNSTRKVLFRPGLGGDLQLFCYQKDETIRQMNMRKGYTEQIPSPEAAAARSGNGRRVVKGEIQKANRYQRWLEEHSDDQQDGRRTL